MGIRTASVVSYGCYEVSAGLLIADVIAHWQAQHPKWFADCTIDLAHRDFDAWASMLDEALQEVEDILARSPTVLFRIMQIKEKFGGLRVYVRCPSNPSMINEIEVVLEHLRVTTTRAP